MKGEKNGIITLTRYEGLMRELAKAVAADGASPDVFEKMAGMMAQWIPDGAVVVPMPGRYGMPLWSHILVKAIVKANPRAYYAGDWLRCDVHEPRKGVGGTRGEPPRMWVDEGFMIPLDVERSVMEWQARRAEAGQYESGAVSCHVLALCCSSLRVS